MNRPEQIAQALNILENTRNTAIEVPAALYMHPDSGIWLVANVEGFIQLAMTVLKAAQGDEQSLASQDWWHNDDLDWCLQSLKLDPDIHNHLPISKSSSKRRLGDAVRLILVSIVVLCAIVGFVTMIRWTAYLLSRHFGT